MEHYSFSDRGTWSRVEMLASRKIRSLMTVRLLASAESVGIIHRESLAIIQTNSLGD